MNPTVTYDGMEVVLLVAMIAACLPDLGPDDYEVADLMLDKAMASLHRPLAPDIESRIAELRSRTDLKEKLVDPLSDRGRVRHGWLRRLLGRGQHRSS